ncbi:MAG TPA: glycine--tRNA ligase subunit beta, partial [Polyangiaceae bacterium]
DTLTGCFAVGLAPTGSADPYALRRNCIAALRLLAEHPSFATLRFEDLVRASYKQFAAVFAAKKADLDENATAAKISEFANERLRGVIAGQTSNAVADAILAGNENALERPANALAKARSLQKVVGEAWIQNARAVGKRLRGISKDAKPENHAFAKDDAKNQRIASVVSTLDLATKDLAKTGVEAALQKFGDVSNELAKIFDEILVNDPNDPTTPQRLEVLSFGASCMLRIADFSRLG